MAGLVIGAIIDYAMDTTNDQDSKEGQRNSFLFSMLVLVSYVIKADGKVMHSEMEVVRRFLRQTFGETAVLQGNEILNRLFEQYKKMGHTSIRTTVANCCAQMADNMDYAERMQLLHLLVSVAKADGNMDVCEEDAIKECATWMRMSQADVESILNLGVNKLEAAYKVLGVSPTATDDEVRNAYRKQVLANHPDRVAALGEDIRKAAEEKLQQINEAKEIVYAARKM